MHFLMVLVSSTETGRSSRLAQGPGGGAEGSGSLAQRPGGPALAPTKWKCEQRPSLGLEEANAPSSLLWPGHGLPEASPAGAG